MTKEMVSISRTVNEDSPVRMNLLAALTKVKSACLTQAESAFVNSKVYSSLCYFLSTASMAERMVEQEYQDLIEIAQLVTDGEPHFVDNIMSDGSVLTLYYILQPITMVPFQPGYIGYVTGDDDDPEMTPVVEITAVDDEIAITLLAPEISIPTRAKNNPSIYDMATLTTTCLQDSVRQTPTYEAIAMGVDSTKLAFTEYNTVNSDQLRDIADRFVTKAQATIEQTVDVKSVIANISTCIEQGDLSGVLNFIEQQFAQLNTISKTENNDIDYESNNASKKLTNFWSGILDLLGSALSIAILAVKGIATAILVVVAMAFSLLSKILSWAFNINVQTNWETQNVLDPYNSIDIDIFNNSGLYNDGSVILPTRIELDTIFKVNKKLSTYRQPRSYEDILMDDVLVGTRGHVITIPGLEFIVQNRHLNQITTGSLTRLNYAAFTVVKPSLTLLDNPADDQDLMTTLFNNPYGIVIDERDTINHYTNVSVEFSLPPRLAFSTLLNWLREHSTETSQGCSDAELLHRTCCSLSLFSILMLMSSYYSRFSWQDIDEDEWSAEVIEVDTGDHIGSFDDVQRLLSSQQFSDAAKWSYPARLKDALDNKPSGSFSDGYTNDRLMLVICSKLWRRAADEKVVYQYSTSTADLNDYMIQLAMLGDKQSNFSLYSDRNVFDVGTMIPLDLLRSSLNDYSLRSMDSYVLDDITEYPLPDCATAIGLYTIDSGSITPMWDYPDGTKAQLLAMLITIGALTAVVATTAVIGSVKYKKWKTKKNFELSNKAEKAWYAYQDGEGSYEEYRKAVKKNNMFSTFFGGGKLSKAGLYADSDATTLTNEILNSEALQSIINPGDVDYEGDPVSLGTSVEQVLRVITNDL